MKCEIPVSNNVANFKILISLFALLSQIKFIQTHLLLLSRILYMYYRPIEG